MELDGFSQTDSDRREEKKENIYFFKKLKVQKSLKNLSPLNK